MKIVPKLDTGPYLIQEAIKIEITDNFTLLSKKLSNIGSKLILESLEKLKKSKVDFIEQDETLATYANKIEKAEAKINWNIEAKKLIAKINGLNPYPGTWFKHLDTRIKILEAIEVNQKGKEGEVLDDNLTIGCKENAIRVISIQKEGKKVLNVKNFLAGHKIKKGERLI